MMWNILSFIVGLGLGWLIAHIYYKRSSKESKNHFAEVNNNFTEVRTEITEMKSLLAIFTNSLNQIEPVVQTNYRELGIRMKNSVEAMSTKLHAVEGIITTTAKVTGVLTSVQPAIGPGSERSV